MIDNPHEILGVKRGSGAAYTLYKIARDFGKIELIVVIRWKTGLGLKESKDLAEAFINAESAVRS